MDPNTQRAEAERWLGIAAKLLTARDFLGSKTFAIRAREADPNNPVSDQILAVVDTVLSGEKRLSTSQQPDWYAVLQLPRLVRDPELVATHYRRLVMLLNPEHNRFPFADYALQVVMDAWSVLSDPTKKWLFDNELAMSLQRAEIQPQTQTQTQTQTPRVDPIRVDPVRVDLDSHHSVAATTPQQLNTFQFFQPPPQHQQPPQQTLPMWQQQPQQQQQQQSQREFMPPPTMPATTQQQHVQQLLPQWQMRDPTPTKGADRTKGISGNNGATTSSTPSAAQLPQTTHPPPPVPVPTPRMAPPPPALPHVGMGPTPVARAKVTPPPANVVDHGNAGNNTTAANNNSSTINSNNNDNNNNAGVGSAGGAGPGPAPAAAAGAAGGSGAENRGEGVESVEAFWTACPYCFYLYEYQKMYKDCTLRCQNCRRGFHAAQIPNPPPIVGGKDGDKAASFCCWGFFPLGFSMAAWKKHNQGGNVNGSVGWAPFSPMFTCPTEDGDGDFHWFANAGGGGNVGRKGREPRVYMDDEDYIELSDPSDSDSSDHDWRNPGTYQKKGKASRKRGRPRKVDHVVSQGHRPVTRGGGTSIGGEDLEEGSDGQEVVLGLVAGARTDTARKSMVNSISRKQTRRSVKDVGRLDLNVEFNNEGEEHAPAVSAVNGEEDGMESIGFFEGLDEFLSTLPILNVGGDEKAKPS